ncbi:M14 family zinc carboxypeptidase [Halobacteriovorax sp. JY17]|uniref:M14 family zinc carboxypeptidase n=1 Tax=Halobacteriovorax sp. JY17 TaxID=2014617 RepID=UPI000C617473|nr:M14 family zinc carboxypeptidase [Halobacteriovorax sp. JY17]PIK16220.1 MAG: zinc carboxypeptidase [Halobacteriovorax sp. JY17]
MNKEFPEAIEIQQLILNRPSIASVEVIQTISFKGLDYPIHQFKVGNAPNSSPTLVLVGGVHGLEKIGTHVVISYLNFLFEQLKWNKDLQNFFDQFNLVAIPIVNPVGVAHNKRSNGNGIDLMRNAPVDATTKSLFLVGGHRISHLLPWYRGKKNTPMQLESETLCKVIKEIISKTNKCLVIDFHSGFGLKDRLWYPYAKSSETFPAIEQVNKIQEVFDRTIPHHIYQIEPQSDQYTTHGDLWDYLFDWKEENFKEHDFIPWTLEMGSWNWLKKNPIQIFSKLGFFNPIKNHRYDRTMRRHLLLIDFFSNITKNWEVWKK